MTTEGVQSLLFEPIKIRPSDGLKRAMDLALCLIALPAAGLLLLFLALLIRLNSRGVAFFSQDRVGLGDRPFRCFKLRTMYEDAEERLEALLACDPALRSEWASHQKLQRDPRITWLGHWLRKTSLDELPQIWNILKGEMSLVGPRPYLPQQLAGRRSEEVKAITAVRPGLTGLWQVSGRSRLSFENRVALDVVYAHQHTLRSDLAILVKTIPMVISSKDAF